MSVTEPGSVPPPSVADVSGPASAVTRRGLAAAMLGIVTLGAFGAKPARAQLFGGGGLAQLGAILAVLEVIRDFTIDIFGELERALRALGINIPWWAWSWLRGLLEALGRHAGPDSTVRNTSVREAVERSYPVDPGRYATADARHELGRIRAEAGRLRVEEAMLVLGGIAESQIPWQEADDRIVADIAESESLVQIARAQAYMAATSASLTRQIVLQNTHIGQLLFDPAMQMPGGLQTQLVMQEQLGIRRDTLSPVGRMPGVP